MSVLDRLRSRLALKIYVIGLLQIVVVIAGIIAYVRLNRPDFEARAAKETALVERISELLDQPEALQSELERAEDAVEATVTVTDPEGRVVASTTPDDAPPCLRARPLRRAPPEPGAEPSSSDQTRRDRPPRHHRRGGRFRGPLCRVGLLTFPDGGYGRIEFRPTKPPGPPSPLRIPVIAFVLVVVGLSTVMLTRSIAKPLGRLSTAARALGQGQLDARTGVERRDELGEVARSFDEMARRVGELLRAERELVANVSHELRTPLARIRVALDIAEDGDAETARESLQDIAGDVDDLERLVSDLLAAARLDIGGSAVSRGGIPPLERETIDPRELVRTAVERFAVTHPERRVKVEDADELPAIEGDPVLLGRAIFNLIDNAHKYTDDADQPIDVSLRSDGEGVTIEIVDHGVGIDEEDLARVFEPFFRGDKSRSRATGGHGLGLALARRIVDAHHGRLELDSEVGRGTRARIFVPERSLSPH